MVMVDSNTLLLLILGLMDRRLVNSHEKTSVYEEEDFVNLIELVGDLNNLIVVPNILTEVDNLLNNFKGERRYKYVMAMMEFISKSTEEYVRSVHGVSSYYFSDLGLTDSIILYMKDRYDLLITSDSMLSDRANSLGINHFDIKAYRNLRFQ